MISTDTINFAPFVPGTTVHQVSAAINSISLVRQIVLKLNTFRESKMNGPGSSRLIEKFKLLIYHSNIRPKYCAFV